MRITRRPRNLANNSASSGDRMTRFHATIGKLQTMLRADPTRQISAGEPCVFDRFNAAVEPGSSFSSVSARRMVNCPTPHCICGPAPRISARVVVGGVVMQPKYDFADADCNDSRKRKLCSDNNSVALALLCGDRVPADVFTFPGTRLARWCGEIAPLSRVRTADDRLTVLRDRSQYRRPKKTATNTRART